MEIEDKIVSTEEQSRERVYRRRFLRKKANVYPEEHCSKCGKLAWDQDMYPDAWYCLICGNVGFYSGGIFKQREYNK